MTELMHTAIIDSSTAVDPAQRDNVVAFEQSAPPAPGAGRAAGHEPDVHRSDVHRSDVHRSDDHFPVQDLTAVSTRQLRIMANQAYRLIDSDYPPAGAVERYQSIVDLLEHRARQATERGPALQPRETFRDNLLYRRFELFVDGRLAAYLKYSMNGGQVNLLDGVEQTGFRDQGFDATLMRHVLLNLHKRRLNVMPQCPMALSFLADHPEFRSLASRTRA